MTARAEVDGKQVEWDGGEWIKTLPSCPDCGEIMVKSWIECVDDSGWYCAWLCGCEKTGQERKEGEDG